MKAYKFTTAGNYTRNFTLWGNNVTHTAKGTGNHLCSNSFIHFYRNPFVAAFVSPLHVPTTYSKLWLCEASGKIVHEPLKSGAKSLTTLYPIPLPTITITQRIAFIILCAKEIHTDKKWNKWADNWLSGKDRTVTSAKKLYNSMFDQPSSTAALNTISLMAISLMAIRALHVAIHSKTPSYVENTVAIAVTDITTFKRRFPFVKITKIAKKALTY